MLIAGWCWRFFHTWTTGPDGCLTIYPQGTVRYREKPGITWRGCLTGHSWHRSQLATVRVELAWGAHDLVIFRCRQGKGAFRRLRRILICGPVSE